MKPDASNVLVGDPAGYTMTVTRKLPGTVDDIGLSAALQKRMVWSVDGGTGQSMCSVVGQTLTCYFDEMDQGMSYSVHVSAVTVKTGTLNARAWTWGPSPYSYSGARGTILVA